MAELPSAFRIPDCPAYWSLHPFGAARLSEEEARNHGFPDVDIRIVAGGRSWDDRVYAGIRQFHEAKGFDPYSQEVALELKYPLCEVSIGQDALFAHGKHTKFSIHLSFIRWFGSTRG